MDKKNKIKILIMVIILLLIFYMINKLISSLIINNYIIKDTKSFYENIYYEQVDISILKGFSKKGINISIKELYEYSNKDNKYQKKYNLSKSYVIIYPISPYGKKDYKIKIKMYKKSQSKKD